MPSPVDVVIVVLAVILPLLYVYRDSLPFIGAKPSSGGAADSKKAAEAAIDPRDWVAKMQKANKRCIMFYGSQTGTAEEYAVRLAKEAKSRYGISSYVCDPEEYDFNKLDAVPSENVVFFVMATYGEGEPTDNALPLMEFLNEHDVEFSGAGDNAGGKPLSNLHYVIFGLGNRTYEHYNAIARKLDARLNELGATRVGKRGEGDDDKSMEEDYLAWKDGLWEAFEETMHVEVGSGGDVADFEVTEVDANEHPADKIFRGELSTKALTGVKGGYDHKNPYPAPIIVARELFSVDADRNCIHVEFDITDSGLTYQHGDHVGVWPSNPDIEVDRILAVLGLDAPDVRHKAIDIKSLDPTLAKVPFPTPATYDAIFRHYLDITSVASRQVLGTLAKYAPNEEAIRKIERVGADKEAYHEAIGGPNLTLGEALQAAVGDDLSKSREKGQVTVWKDIPFDRIISSLPRLQPRYYSISSSSKLYPNAIHITAVVLKYQSEPSRHHKHQPRWVYGVGTNFILNVKNAHNGEETDVKGNAAENKPDLVSATAPTYKITGPRDAHRRDDKYLVPIHVRRSTFRLPTSPKVPVIMIGPGTGVAPFRGFLQERIAAVQKSAKKPENKGKSTEEIVQDWADMYLFYGCRTEDDYLYKEEWPEYGKQLGGKLKMQVAESRGPKRKPDGSKIYVQDLLWDLRETLAPLILENRAYVYICGDAKGMAKAVEEALQKMLGEAKGGTAEKEGMKEYKLLKERNRLLLDVWS